MDDRERTLLEATLAATDGGRGERVALGRGDLVGRYVVLEKIGEGGMGVVFAAYDPELDRKVALKLLHAQPSNQSKATEGHKRLLREAQAMAQLSHPNVITIHDVGVCEAGPHAGSQRVFLAMEFVDGVTLGQWLAAQSRGLTQILDTFSRAGRGLAAAHTKSIVHRDFKPDNVMIGDDGRVRVMDFGLARPTGQRPGQADLPKLVGEAGLDDLVTQTGSILGTPAYMAPEQWLGDATDFATDQFSFCVALWQALFGHRPFAGKTAAELLVNVTQGVFSDAARRRDVPGSVLAAMRRGLSTTPADRFPSMDALLTAIQPPVSRRGRWFAGAGVLGVVALAGGALGYQRWDEQRLRDSCADAGAAILESWDDARREELRRALEQSGVSEPSVTFEKATHWLDGFVEEWRATREQTCLNTRVDGTASEDTRQRTVWCLEDRRMEFDALLTELTAADRGVAGHAVTAAAALPRVGPCTRPEMLARMPGSHAMGDAGHRWARGELARVRALKNAGRYTEALELARETVRSLQDSEWRPLFLRGRIAVAHLLQKTGGFEESAEILRDTYFEAGRIGATEIAADAASAQVFTMFREAKPDDALLWGELAQLELLRLDIHDDDIMHAELANGLALVHRSNADYQTAEELHVRALEITERGFGPNHPSVATALNNLAALLQTTGSYTEAKPLLERALAIRREALGTSHPDVARSLNNLANNHQAHGDFERAQVLTQEALEIATRAHGPDHPELASILNNLALIHEELEDVEGAAPLYERALEIFEKALGPEHPNTATILNNLGHVRHEAGQFDEALELCTRARTIWEEALGPEHPSVAYASAGIAEIMLDRGTPAQALGPARRALALREQHDTAPELLASTRFVLARALLEGEGDRDASLELAHRARDEFNQLGEPYSRELAEVTAFIERLDAE